jgi:hypothetical protein
MLRGTSARSALSPMEAALALARSPEELRLVAQPLVDTGSGEIAGFELLARFPRAWGVLPHEVFEAAETHGLSPALTCHVLEKSARLFDAADGYAAAAATAGCPSASCRSRRAGGEPAAAGSLTNPAGSQASTTTGMIIGRRRWALETQRPMTRRIVCCSW